MSWFVLYLDCRLLVIERRPAPSRSRFFVYEVFGKWSEPTGELSGIGRQNRHRRTSRAVAHGGFVMGNWMLSLFTVGQANSATEYYLGPFRILLFVRFRVFRGSKKMGKSKTRWEKPGLTPCG